MIKERVARVLIAEGFLQECSVVDRGEGNAKQICACG